MKKTMKERVAALTPRQREVVRLTSLGCTVREIAAILGLAPNTVDNHRTRAMKVLDTDKAVLMTRVALEHRISTLKDKLTRAEQLRSNQAPKRKPRRKPAKRKRARAK